MLATTAKSSIANLSLQNTTHEFQNVKPLLGNNLTKTVKNKITRAVKLSIVIGAIVIDILDKCQNSFCNS